MFYPISLLNIEFSLKGFWHPHFGACYRCAPINKHICSVLGGGDSPSQVRAYGKIYFNLYVRWSDSICELKKTNGTGSYFARNHGGKKKEGRTRQKEEKSVVDSTFELNQMISSLIILKWLWIGEKYFYSISCILLYFCLPN